MVAFDIFLCYDSEIRRLSGQQDAMDRCKIRNGPMVNIAGSLQECKEQSHKYEKRSHTHLYR